MTKWMEVQALEVNKITTEFKERYFRFFPEKATHLGDHRFDRLMGDWSRQGVKEKINFFKHYRDLVNNSLETSALVLKNITESHLFHLQNIKPYLHPDFFVKQALSSIDKLIYLLEKVKSKQEQQHLSDSLVARVSMFPILFEQSRQWLKKTSQVSKESALYQIIFFKKFLETDYRNFITALEIESKYREKLIGVIPFTLENLQRFENFVKTIEIVQVSEKEMVHSDMFFKNIFKKKYLLDFSVAALIKKTEKRITCLKSDLNHISRNNIASYYRTMTDKGQIKSHSKNKNDLIIKYFRDQSIKYLDFCAETDLFPKTEQPLIQWTPKYKRNTSPVASYHTRGPFETMITHGIFNISPGHESRFHKQFMNSIVIHELVGHHTAAETFAEQKKNKFQFSDNLSFDEGFALYAEEIFAREFSKSLADKKEAEEMIFFMKKAELMRAYRVITDIAIGTGRMDLDEGIKYFEENNNLDHETAKKECQNYMLNPGTASSYLIGKFEIIDMLDYFKEKRKKKFSLTEFNRQLLSFGSIPLSLVRRQLDGT